jgi:hypothetical protein
VTGTPTAASPVADLQTSRESVYPLIRDARAARLDKEKAVR